MLVKYTRPVIILGPMRHKIMEDLMAESPDKFESCIPDTSRSPRENEEEGREYHFIEREKMEIDISKHLYIEAGKFKDNFYGTSVAAVREIAVKGKHCLLDVSTKAIVPLQVANFYPIIILVKPTSVEALMEMDVTCTEGEARRSYNDANQLETELKDDLTAVVQGESFKGIYAKVKKVILNNSSPVTSVPAKDKL